MNNDKFSIFLGGGGGYGDSVAIDTIFFASLSNNARILYMPFARDEYDTDWIMGLVRQYSETMTLDMLSEADAPDVNLSNYDAVYIGGGNTYKLLDFIITSGLDAKLKNYLRYGGLIYGGSAGAIIMGKSIDTSSAMDDRGNYKYDIGLDLLHGACIAPHWPQNEEYIRQFSMDNKYKIYCIPENCGMIFDKNGELVKTAGIGNEII